MCVGLRVDFTGSGQSAGPVGSLSCLFISLLFTSLKGLGKQSSRLG